MKYHAILTPALTSLCLLTSTTVLASDSTKLSVEEQARWFEIEVIIFKQVSKKGQSKEAFNAKDLTEKKRFALDLLTPYIQPDIASLKQLLPRCGEPSANFPYNIEPAAFTLWPIDSSAKETEISVAENKATRTEVNNNSLPSEQILASNAKADNKTASMSVTVLSSASDRSNSISANSEVEGATPESTAITDGHTYQAQYANVILPAYNQYPSDSDSPLCIIPADFFQQHLSPEKLEHFSIDGFPVDKLATTIDGLEQWHADENGEITWASDKPYLISQDSLRLKSIANRIKRSRNYAPLLHLGWRQIGETKRKAKAMKLYAGQHLDLDYQQALSTQAAQQSTLEIKAILDNRQQTEALMLNQQHMVNNFANGTINAASNSIDNGAIPENNLAVELSGTDDMNAAAIRIDELSITEELRQQAKQQQLDKLFQQFAQFNEQNEQNSQENSNHTDNLISNIDANNAISEAEIKRIVAELSTEITAQVNPQLDAKTNLEKPAIISVPLQPWYLDGLFKVHLDHYLYINSELNIVEKNTLAGNTLKNTDKTTKSQQIISFKQDRRVISGEIHYFDHPHIGMVVQIRRFDPTKPAAEAVSQSKK